MSEPRKKTALIGGGVIGGGWAARFLLNGIDVNVFDPSDSAERTLNEMLSNARRAYSKMTMAPLVQPGNLLFFDSLENAVQDVDFIQESAPERLELKRSIINQIDQYASETVLICSSTSGLKPTLLQAEMKHPERFMVGHPFNPVYLLPLIEICGGEKTSEDAKLTAAEFYREVGMKPLILRKEIDAFIADRLLEAVWREGLWLIRDDVASTEELDDAIRFGFGLRWAQMGLFETYRVAGGESGVRHFISQFGPTLGLPWTKLMNVPELDEELIEKIVLQSDTQSGMYSIRELERIRDDNLVAIMQGLKLHDWGAGALLKEYEERLYQKAHSGIVSSDQDFSKPLSLFDAEVLPEWLDYNGHMTESRYLQVFGDATDALLNYIGMDEAYRSGGFSVYTVETHIRHLLEIAGGEPLTVETQLLGLDEKRLRIVHKLLHTSSGDELATGEHMLLHVDTEARCASPFGKKLYVKLEKIWLGHQNLTVPDYSGNGIQNLKSIS
ncbi:carnitine 3-dehydrogenase [Deltaproteobacteria bacterium]|nr:carnitine 3-dehydrogenase [Deltaproteobacteria bacterium]